MTAQNAEVSAREIVSTRMIDAPRELVFAAWTDPAHLAKWWGPKGFTNTFEMFDCRPGGRWTFVMHGPDGVDYPNACEFVEIVEPERIVFRHLEPMHHFRVTATFEDQDGRTKLTFRMLFDDATERDRIHDVVMEANEQNFDRLEAELAAMTAEIP